MTGPPTLDPSDPKRDAKVARWYRRHERRGRWAKCRDFVARAVMRIIALAASAAIVYTCYIAYQDHGRLAELYHQAPTKSIELAVPPETFRWGETVGRSPGSGPVPPPANPFQPGTWEEAAQKYIDTQLAQAITSANPPPHRHKVGP